MANLPAGNQDALRVGNFAIHNKSLKPRALEFFNWSIASG